MCGITGFFGVGSRLLLESMNQAILHRGPDEDGFFLAPPVGLAMRRLSIIDLSGGRQPIANENGRIRIVLNGEIYNYRELRQAYLQSHTFRTASDTEVIVHLYEEYGTEAFTMLNGMFAFALWDAEQGALYLVRDRLGIKPLYYHEGSERLTFASELKALLQDREIPRSIDPLALDAYLAWQYVPGPQTMLQGIKKLPPGHYLRLKEGFSPRLNAYWEAILPIPGSAPSRKEDFLTLFRAAVHRQLVSDVPVGAFLSGGIDSSLVVALMKEAAGSGLETFTAGFADPRFDESPWAAQVARSLNVRHHIIQLDATALDALPTLVWHLDEPVADRAALPTYFLSKAARELVKVVLTGEGSDELFAGYPRYRLERLAQAFHRFPMSQQQGLWRALLTLAPPGLRGRLSKLLLSHADAAERRQAWVGNFTPELRRRLLIESGGAFPSPRPTDGSLEAQLLLDLRTWLVDNVLMKVDKMTMAASLEARVPFLDHEVVDWSLALPMSEKLAGSETKHVVKYAASRLLPEEIIHRPKQAFHTPVDGWFREPHGRDLLGDALLGATSRNRGLLVASEVERLLKSHREGRNNGQALWNLLVLELWLRAYLD